MLSFLKNIGDVITPPLCPICGSEQITYDGSEIDGQYMYYKCCCDKCNATFNEFYELVYAGMENIIRGDK